MIKEKIKIEFDQIDLKVLLCQKYNLDVNSSSLTLYHYEGNPREAEYTKITLEGIKK